MSCTENYQRNAWVTTVCFLTNCCTTRPNSSLRPIIEYQTQLPLIPRRLRRRGKQQRQKQIENGGRAFFIKSLQGWLADDTTGSGTGHWPRQPICLRGSSGSDFVRELSSASSKDHGSSSFSVQSAATNRLMHYRRGATNSRPRNSVTSGQ